MVVDPSSLALALLHAFALSLAFVMIPAQCCCVGLKGLPLLTDVVHLALSLEMRLLALPALVAVAWIFVVSVAVVLVALLDVRIC